MPNFIIQFSSTISLMQELLVCPEGGLANRMRVLASVFALQDQQPCLIKCYWTLRVGELCAPFNQLFEPISGLEIADPPLYLSKLRPVLSRFSWRRLLLRLINKAYGVDAYLYEDSSHPGAIEAGLPDALAILTHSSSASVLIRSWQGFGDYHCFLKRFQPIFPLQQRITALSPLSPMVGIHVRRGDHTTAIRNSPLAGFFIAADSALEQQPGSYLFLCSDSSSVRTAFKRRYGNRVLVSQAELSRSSIGAIQDAVVDLFSLARCSSIIGSYRSSFSELAAMLGQRPLQTIGPAGFHHAS
jgi:hypothetical protein